MPTPTITPLTEWYPELHDLWVRDGRRLTGPTHRSGYTVHHTAGGVGHNPLSYARFVARMHYFDAGWERPGGYNFLIGSDGSIFEMCGWEFVGAHARGCNYSTIGVAFQGTFNIKLPSLPQLNSFGWLVRTHPVPNIQQGHRDCQETSCPGQVLYDYLPIPINNNQEDNVPNIIDFSSTNEQLEDLVSVLTNSNKAEVARHFSYWREVLGKAPDPVSDAIWGERIVLGETSLQEALERIKEEAPDRSVQ